MNNGSGKISEGGNQLCSILFRSAKMLVTRSMHRVGLEMRWNDLARRCDFGSAVWSSRNFGVAYVNARAGILGQDQVS